MIFNPISGAGVALSEIRPLCPHALKAAKRGVHAASGRRAMSARAIGHKARPNLFREH
jgi:hypothetical protein